MQIQPELPSQGHRQGRLPDNPERGQNSAHLRGSAASQLRQVDRRRGVEQDEEEGFI